MKRFWDEIGLRDRYRDLQFIKSKDVEKTKDEASLNNDMADHSFNYHMNALFWPINLVDYERDLSGS